jgi:hypothetical protein
VAELTQEQKEYYIEKRGTCCPHCKSDNIIGGMIEGGSDTAWQIVTCNDCKKQWREVYELSNIEEVTL